MGILEALGVTIAGAFFAACWHILARNERPEFEDLAVGFDLLVAAVVLEFGFMPGSHGGVMIFRLAGVVILFVLIAGMAVVTRFVGYQPTCEYKKLDDPSSPLLSISHMTTKSVWVTSALGCAFLCVTWWLNVNAGLIISDWQKL